LLRGATADEVRGYLDQLMALRLLRQTDDAYPVVQLTAEGLALMKDPAAGASFELARQRKPEKHQALLRSRAEKESWDGVDRTLFERLRELRLAVARERGVPPYVVFHDATLREMARLRPATADALRGIYGVGARKAEDLGDAVLAVIRGHAGVQP
jgi:ATP-dependent DNA helicase RecQ